tara:strand:+ start:2749 stop:3213 length:465 start_codon:yes stop_codon:yes gene_type:complete
MAVTPPTLDLRLQKQQPLTATEMDDNLSNLKAYTTNVETTVADGTGFVDNTVSPSKLTNGNPGQVVVGATTTGVFTATTLSGDATLAGDGVLTLSDSGVHTNATPQEYDNKKFTVNRKGQITAVTDGVTHHVSTSDPVDATDGNDGDFWYKYYA